ncbi:hypothetical protein SAMN04487996_105140 [Dyadobacter soli]|uniref:Uncharacterized protein n=1 Tax=Dyadobacter soli TaxID=659014 RepID=A0A1G7D862_9BACT|nr:hypothetical protein [Dyadobacter soli]SDE47180.1 hypothetical protein SAMN04487996_105140 [Dyadobacter soli]
MTDTPEHIKQLQLQIWLAKSPMDRLRQMMLDNEALFVFWNNARMDLSKTSGMDQKSFENNDSK